MLPSGLALQPQGVGTERIEELLAAGLNGENGLGAILEGLSDLVNADEGLSAVITNPLSAAFAGAVTKALAG